MCSDKTKKNNDSKTNTDNAIRMLATCNGKYQNYKNSQTAEEGWVPGKARPSEEPLKGTLERSPLNEPLNGIKPIKELAEGTFKGTPETKPLKEHHKRNPLEDKGTPRQLLSPNPMPQGWGAGCRV